MELPKAFEERMRRLLGEEYEDFRAAYEQPEAQALRVNTGKLSKEAFLSLAPFSLERVPWTRNGFYYGKEDRPGRHVYHEAGLYYMQEPSAMAVGELAGARPGERVLDLCAAPGGKTTHLASDMKSVGLLVSNEIHPARAKILAQNVERMGIAHAVVTNETPDRLAERFPAFFHRIVVDAPCSGEGMFRKDPEACEQWSPDNVKHCAERQQGILEAAARMLLPGGTLVYSTCTFAPEENEGTIGAFLELHPDFHLVRKAPFDGWFAPGHPEWVEHALQSTVETYRLWPHKLRGEGHFAAVLVRDGTYPESTLLGVPGSTDAGNESKVPAREKKQKKNKGGKSVSALDEARLLFSQFVKDALVEPEVWGKSMDDVMHAAQEMRNGNAIDEKRSAQPKDQCFEMEKTSKGQIQIETNGEKLALLVTLQIQAALAGTPGGAHLELFGDHLWLVPSAVDLNGLKVLRAGLELGTVKKNRFEPAQALAQALRAEETRSCCDTKVCAGDDRAVRYLRGESLPADAPGEDGWCLVLADGYPLGWGKRTGDVVKNHYPKGLRKERG